MNYLLLTNNCEAALSEAVNTHLSEGWLLYGPPSMAITEEEEFYCQAVVKNDISLHSFIEMQKKAKEARDSLMKN